MSDLGGRPCPILADTGVLLRILKRRRTMGRVRPLWAGTPKEAPKRKRLYVPYLMPFLGEGERAAPPRKRIAMVNSIECLNAIDELVSCRKELEAGDIRKANKRMHAFRHPGQWEYGRLSRAYDVALSITGLLKDSTTFGEDSMKKFILRTVAPILEMKIRR